MNELNPENGDPSVRSESENAVDVEQLVWMLLDEKISDQQFQHLDKLLREEAHARATYVKCVQLHLDLTEHFSPDTNGKNIAAKKSPVLGFLSQMNTAPGADLSQHDTPPPGAS